MTLTLGEEIQKAVCTEEEERSEKTDSRSRGVMVWS